ncbi:legumain-like [Hemibagrus wyckioides]|uniref:legumain-like n=1 Tax=Hemibagrus wyckioides TaxID=337641 RepID=UPI00266BB4DF|nr:legumain-like [Hemibagrus wyckioides]
MMEVQDVVANKDVAMMILQKKIQSAKTPEEKEQFEKQMFELHQGREMVIKSMKQVVEKCTDSDEAMQEILHGRSQAYASREYKEVVEHYREKCFDWHEAKYQSSMDHLYLFANLLDKKVSVERIKNAIDEVGAAMRAEKEKESTMGQ